MDLIEILTNVFISLPGLAAGVLALTSFVKKYIKTKDSETIFVSAASSVVLSALGYWRQLGIFEGTDWYYILLYGAAAMLMANGLSTWEIIKQLLIVLKLRWK